MNSFFRVGKCNWDDQWSVCLSACIVKSKPYPCLSVCLSVQSTPKGKNSTPTLISSPELRKAVGAILDQGSEYLMGAIEGCDPGVRYQELPPVMEIVEASGQSTNINTHDIQGQVNVTEDSKLSADTVGVAEALVELAGGGNLSVFTP